VRAIHDLGLQHSVALVGIDHVALADVVARRARDRSGSGGLRRAAAQLLFARLEGFRGQSREVILTTRLVARESGELPPPRS
jgi:LacI family transcriptional regulator